MGNCCSGKNEEEKQIDMQREGLFGFTAEGNHLVTLIKIQAAVRAYLASKEVQSVRRSEFHGFQNTQAQNGNYTNDIVQKLS